MDTRVNANLFHGARVTDFRRLLETMQPGKRRQGSLGLEFRASGSRALRDFSVLGVRHGLGVQGQVSCKVGHNPWQVFASMKDCARLVL